MIKLTKEEIEKYQKLYESLYNDPRILRMKEFSQHRGSSPYVHSLKVARRAYWIAKRWWFKVNFEDLLIGAMLHDYCLYTWRGKSGRFKFAARHPKTSCKNAERDFKINDRIKNIILSHMWPLNFFCFHKSKEAHIVALADDIIAIEEGLCSIKWKVKRKDKYFDKIFCLENPKKYKIKKGHILNLHDSPYKAIENGCKTIEMRLNEKKRQCLKAGDYIQFKNRTTEETMIVQIISVSRYSSFDELYNNYDKIELGYESNQEANPNDMGQYYSKEKMAKYGVLAIKIRKI